jgi:hypothetical protein
MINASQAVIDPDFVQASHVRRSSGSLGVRLYLPIWTNWKR